MLHLREHWRVQMLPAPQSPVQSALSLHVKEQLAPPALQSMSHCALPVHVIAHRPPLAQSSLQSLLPSQASWHGGFEHVKRHLSMPVQVQLGPHSPLVDDEAPVSRVPLSCAGLGGVPESESIVAGNVSSVPLPMFQS